MYYKSCPCSVPFRSSVIGHLHVGLKLVRVTSGGRQASRHQPRGEVRVTGASTTEPRQAKAKYARARNQATDISQRMHFAVASNISPYNTNYSCLIHSLSVYSILFTVLIQLPLVYQVNHFYY